MTHLTFAGADDNVIGADYASTGTGPVLRSDQLEVRRIHFERGGGAEVHTHPEEQLMYVLSGRLEVTCGDETYVVNPGEATFNASNVPHGVRALDDVVVLSVKNQVAPTYEATGRLGG